MNMTDVYCRKGDEGRCGLALAVLFIALGVIAVFGCSGRDKQIDKPTFMEAWQVKAGEAVGHSPVREKLDLDFSETIKAIESTREPPATGTGVSLAPEEKSLPADVVSLKMHDVDLSVLLRALAKIANQNIMINENVEGKTSINIQRAPWDQVFLGVLKTHGLTYRWEKDIIRIVTVKDLANELELQKENQNFKIKSEEYKRDILSLRKQNEAMLTRVIPVRYGDLDKIKETLDKILKARREAARAEGTAEEAGSGGKSVEGEVLADAYSHSLVIHARKSDMIKLVELVRDLDRPTPQIRIEAHIVEATENTARNLGVQWSGLYLNASGDNFNWFGGNAADTGQTLYDANQTPQWMQPSTGNLVNNVPEAIGTSGGSLAYTLQQKGIGLLSVQLRALETDGELNILSRPSITTLDNQKATIESGKEVPYQTVEDGEVKIEYKKVVLELTVTPHMIDGKTLRLEIATKNDELDWVNAVGGQPAITTRKAETTIVLFDGQTTVIGGLSKKNITDSESGVPGLKDLPVLGYLFKGTSKNDTLDELLIFITPHILKEHGALKSEE